MLKQVSKKTAKEWESTTTPLLNFMNQLSAVGRIRINKSCMDLLGWYRELKLDTHKERKEYLAKKLGKPLYHANYVAREAVWAFEFKKRPVVLYYSTRGMSIQLGENFPLSDIPKLISYLKSAIRK